MKKSVLGFALFVTTVLIPFTAKAANVSCPSSVESILSRASTISLISCSSEENYYFVVQDYKGDTQEYAGITLSVYDAENFSNSSKPLAVVDGLGELAMKFKFDGKLVDRWILDPSRDPRPGIVLRLWNPPGVGILATFRYNSNAKKLEQIGAIPTDIGNTPDLSDGVFVISGIDPYNNNAPYAKIYNFDGGRFTLKSQGSQ